MISDCVGLFWGENHEKELEKGGAGTVSPDRRDASGVIWGKAQLFPGGKGVLCDFRRS